MKSVLKWIGIVIGGLVVVAGLAIAWIFVSSNSIINETYGVEPVSVTVPEADSATVARGFHVVATHGCMDCHGANLAGRLFLDEMPMARVSSSNLTPAGVGATYTDEDWVRAIRHGVGPDGRSFWIMPSAAFQGLSETDLGAMIAYLKTLPPIESEEPVKEVGPIGRMLMATGQLKLPAMKADHDMPLPPHPIEEATAEFGEYIVYECRYCHGGNLAGGLEEGPPGSPLSANLTPDESGIAHYTEADFFNALRRGTKPDGTEMDPEVMPWTSTAAFTDTEIRALWTYLQSLEPLPMGSND